MSLPAEYVRDLDHRRIRAAIGSYLVNAALSTDL
jgi:hypothetical protein